MTDEDQHDHLLWHEMERRQLLETPVFRVHSSRRRAHDGAVHDYVLVDAADWCTIIAPVTGPDGTACFVMVRQYRHGSGRLTVEFPGGIVDEDEDPAAAALRELEEETGYTAGRLKLIGRLNPNPAFMRNTVSTYLAEGVKLNSGQSLDAGERVDVVLRPVQDIVTLVPSDFHDHAIMLSSLMWYRLYESDGLGYEQRLAAWKTRGGDTAAEPPR